LDHRHEFLVELWVFEHSGAYCFELGTVSKFLQSLKSWIINVILSCLVSIYVIFTVGHVLECCHSVGALSGHHLCDTRRENFVGEIWVTTSC